MLDGHSAIVWQGTIYIWGGKAEPATLAVGGGGGPVDGKQGPVYYSADLFALDPARCTSASSAELTQIRINNGADRSAVPRGRAYHSAALHGNKDMIITGGLTDDVENGGEVTNVHLHIFDLERRVWQRKTTYGDVPCPRCHHSSVVYGDTLFVHGGYPLLSDRKRDVTADDMARMQHAMYDVCELNVPTMRWRRIQVAHSPALWGHSAIRFQRSVIVFGGVDVMENVESGALAVWHTEKKQWRWSDFPDFDHRCAMHTAIEENGRMFVFGGVSFRTNSKLRHLWEFNLEYGQWRELHPTGSPPLGRIGHAMVGFNGCLFVIGGTAEDPNDPSARISGGRAERVCYVYNIALNEWRACALSSTAPQADNTAAASKDARDRANLASQRERSWAAGAIDPSVARGVEQEWASTASQVKDSIARARAIQQLSDSALQQVAHEQQDMAQGRASPTRDPNAVVPFDDTRRLQPQPQQGASPQSAQRVAQAGGVAYPTSAGSGASVASDTAPAGVAADADLQRLQAERARLDAAAKEAADEEARRVIEYQQREIERLKANLEHFQNLSVNGGLRNPYEVPLYNQRSASGFTIAADNEPGTGGDASEARRRLHDALGDFVPRVNLSVADPPRAVGGGQTGYMSRSAVSSLVASSLRAGATNAAANAAAAAASTTAAASAAAGGNAIDPMAYLMRPGAAAQAAAMSATGVSSYDALASRAPQPTVNGSPRSGAYPVAMVSPEHSQQVPQTLQPLLGLLAGVPQSTAAAGGTPQAAGAGYQQQQQPTPSVGFAPTNDSFAMNTTPQFGPGATPGGQSQSTTMGGGGGVAARGAGGGTSLSGLLTGRTSMLSL